MQGGGGGEGRGVQVGDSDNGVVREIIEILSWDIDSAEKVKRRDKVDRKEGRRDVVRVVTGGTERRGGEEERKERDKIKKR